MSVNKVECFGEVLIDLTNDTVTPKTLAEGVTAHDASGNVIRGVAPTDAVRYNPQTLTEAQKEQARQNIDVVSSRELSEAIADYGTLTLGVHTDGLVYIFKNGAPVGIGVNVGTDGDVVGYVDENNNIIVTGNLADGSYSVKYEMENGTVIDIGALVVDTNVYYSITNNLTNCTTSNNAAQVTEGESYSATITANDGYELSSVVVTMGGTAVTVTDGVISIESVTGDIVITAGAKEIVIEPTEPTNFAEPNETNTTDWTIWCNDARFGSDGAYRQLIGNSVTNYFKVEIGDVLYINGLNIATTGTSMNQGLVFYKEDKTTKVSASYLSWYMQDGYCTISSDDTTSLIIDTSGMSNHSLGSELIYARLSGKVSGTFDEVEIKIKRNGKWL